MKCILADGLISAEEAAKALADQSYNHPTNWWLVFIASIATTGLVVLIVRAFKKSDVTEELLRKANEDRLAIATGYQVLSARLSEDIKQLKEAVNELKEELLRYIYRSGGGK